MEEGLTTRKRREKKIQMMQAYPLATHFDQKRPHTRETPPTVVCARQPNSSESQNFPSTKLPCIMPRVRLQHDERPFSLSPSPDASFVNN